MRRIGVLLLLCVWWGQCTATPPRTAIEAFDFDELRLVHIYLGNKNQFRQPYATVVDPKGYIHHVIKGSYVDKDRSMITEIHKEFLVISRIRADKTEEFVRWKVNPRLDSNARSEEVRPR